MNSKPNECDQVTRVALYNIGVGIGGVGIGGGASVTLRRNFPPPSIEKKNLYAPFVLFHFLSLSHTHYSFTISLFLSLSNTLLFHYLSLSSLFTLIQITYGSPKYVKF